MNKTFVLSDESVNCYNMIVRTSGIDLENFKRNPVMFYNHNRELGVIGRWENIRVEEGRLLADPVFDDLDELGKKIGTKVERDFIRSASIGIDIKRWEDGKKCRIVTHSVMCECSVCDIPANSNAIALYKDKERITDVGKYLELYFNMNLKNDEMNDFFKKVGELLKIEDLTEEKIMEAIQKLLQQRDNGELVRKLEESLSLHFIDAGMYQTLSKMGVQSPDVVLEFLEQMREKKEQEAGEKIEQYFVSQWEKFKMFTQTDRDILKKVAELDFDLFCRVANLIEPPMRPTDFIRSGGRQTLKSQWTLDDYRKNAPEELKKNPELYRRLIEEEEKKQK